MWVCKHNINKLSKKNSLVTFSPSFPDEIYITFIILLNIRREKLLQEKQQSTVNSPHLVSSRFSTKMCLGGKYVQNNKGIFPSSE